MDLNYFYYQYRYQYYKLIFLKLRLSESWSKLSSAAKFLYTASVCFGSAFAGWLLVKFLEKRTVLLSLDSVDDWEDKRSLSKRRQKGIPPGLFNEGNTCFTNCVMQALASSPSFYKWTCEVVLQYGVSDITLFPSVNKLLKVLKNVTGNEDVYSTGDVMDSLQSHGWVISREQQDAYEFFQVLISTMDEELCRISCIPSESFLDLEKESKLSDSIRNKVSKHLPILMNNEFTSPFKGSFATKMSCLTCGQQLPVKFEMFDSVILSLVNMSPFSASLHGCLDEWVKPELLHKVKCNKCSAAGVPKYSSFSKQVSFAKLPSCLCIQLQRTTYTSYGAADKNEIFVKYPEYLDVLPYTYGNILSADRQRSKMKNSGLCCLPGGSNGIAIQEKCSSQRMLYSLSSIIVHYGGVDGGHFVSYRRLASNVGKWVRTSDSNISIVSLDNALMTTAYLLYYEKIS